MFSFKTETYSCDESVFDESSDCVCGADEEWRADNGTDGKGIAEAEVVVAAVPDTLLVEATAAAALLCMPAAALVALRRATDDSIVLSIVICGN